ncbi:hypothetical protein CTAYLR_008090 [Chrysophaeum taylorii]|uniref:DNA replication licensing factor MCM5 n=1 Tax=Chrysophaeum taylorii TaxID=2483200 RepID=A0AAD7XSN7_9STRA|nr:hypothetical protein CTAYLR_008090 [Chrysophaeum taylorii]
MAFRGGEAEMIMEEEEEETLRPEVAQKRYGDFFRNFRTVAQEFPYREQLIDQYRRGVGSVAVELSDLNQFDPRLLHMVQARPDEQIKVLEAAAREVLRSLVVNRGSDEGGDDQKERQIGEVALEEARLEVQVLVSSSQQPLDIRSLTADHVNQLIKLSGIIVSASKVAAKITMAQAICKTCGHIKRIPCTSPFGMITPPTKCESNRGRPSANGEESTKGCVNNPYVLMGDLCRFIDQQTLKLQELPEAVPTGEMPRSILLVCDRNLVDTVAPGARVSVVGVSSLFENKNKGPKGGDKSARGASLRTPYLKVAGIDFDLFEGGRGSTASSRFSPADEERFQAIGRRPDVRDLVARSIAPSISGDYTVDIKRAIACLLFGGSSKELKDGAKLRGDINVLLLGDPSTAKSQFLKFVEKVAPVGVYTSGKGSSAAGLTASVIRGHNNEFYLEGGAMVLADGGVCCIDEFDKMRETDRVAIHEAMEQQTISIAKAGICTVLNSRTSVLAAANPVFGRYDDLKSAAENIDMMSTILSRFDMIFIVRDVRDEDRDIAIAKHVMGVHINAGLRDNNSARNRSLTLSAANASAGAVTKKRKHAEPVAVDTADVLDPPTLKQYVQYCRAKCQPRLNEETSKILAAEYVAIRQSMKQQAEEVGGRKNMPIPITVRQLEATVRISEALAKMRLQEHVQPADVQEALRLFKVSTMSAAKTRAQGTGADLQFLAEDARKGVQNAEAFLKQRLPVGTDGTTLKLIEEGIALGHSDFSMRRAIYVMTKRHELMELDRTKRLRRTK